MKWKVVFVLAATLVLGMAVIVSALSFVSQEVVQSCFDSDNGIKLRKSGAVSGISKSGESFEYKDFCVADSVVREYNCFEYGGVLSVKVWEQDCSDYYEFGEHYSGEVCSLGKCAEPSASFSGAGGCSNFLCYLRERFDSLDFEVR